MIIDEVAFHDSQILEVKETSEQTIDFLIHFPTDWENEVYEQKVLRFLDVTDYIIKEIPFSGRVTILDIVNLGQVDKVWGEGRNQLKVTRNRVEMQTNAGNRIIEFSICELIAPE